jgi:hypothetical protein
MAWTPPQNYQPKAGYPEALSQQAPQAGSALFDMTMYWMWTRQWWKNKTHEQAWQDLHLSPDNARKAIDQQIVPPEIYDEVLARAEQP